MPTNNPFGFMTPEVQAMLLGGPSVVGPVGVPSPLAGLLGLSQLDPEVFTQLQLSANQQLGDLHQLTRDVESARVRQQVDPAGSLLERQAARINEANRKQLSALTRSLNTSEQMTPEINQLISDRLRVLSLGGDKTTGGASGKSAAPRR